MLIDQFPPDSHWATWSHTGYSVAPACDIARLPATIVPQVAIASAVAPATSRFETMVVLTVDRLGVASIEGVRTPEDRSKDSQGTLRIGLRLRAWTPRAQLWL